MHRRRRPMESPRSSDKRFLLLTHSYFPQDPRPRRQTRTLRDNGFTVECICLKDRGQLSKEDFEGVHVHRMPIRHVRSNMTRYILEYVSFLVLAFFRISFLHLKSRFDVIQVNTLPDFLVFAAIVPRLTGCRIVLDMHEPSPEFFAAHFRRSLRSPMVSLVTFVEKIATRFAHHILVSGGAAREAIERRGVPAAKISVVPNSCEKQLFKPSRNGQPPSPEDELRLIFHGTIIERYGIDTAIRAIHFLLRSRKKIRLDIYGEGEHRTQLEEMVRRLDLGDAVRFHGYIPPEEIPGKIAEAHIGLIPYKKDIFTDLMLPNKLFEYVAMKKPFIVSPIRAILDHYPESLLNTFPSESEYDLAREVIRIQENGEESRRRADELYRRYEDECWGRVSEVYLGAVAGGMQ